MDNKQIINKWFGLLVDSIYRYDDTIRIEDIYKLVQDMHSIDIVNTYYLYEYFRVFMQGFLVTRTYEEYKEISDGIITLQHYK